MHISTAQLHLHFTTVRDNLNTKLVYGWTLQPDETAQLLLIFPFVPFSLHDCLEPSSSPTIQTL